MGRCKWGGHFRGGGRLTHFHAVEDDLTAAFRAPYPAVKRLADEREILEPPRDQARHFLHHPGQAAPLGIRVMRAGKDYMADKLGVTSLELLEEVRRVQKETRRIDCSDVVPPYGRQVVDDVLNRTETAMSQTHCFLATELVLKAQAWASRTDKFMPPKLPG